MIERERWLEIEDLFDRVSALPPDRRSQFLRESSADAALVAEVEDLLLYHPGSQAALRSTIAAGAEELRRLDAEELSGKRIGAYDLVRAIGQGGMGTVYLAVRSDREFQQQVAIKIVNRGMDNEAFLTRFRQERQVLANLSHPNIARLLDGGATPEGLPYFAMEYLDGTPIAEYCRKQNLSLGERLRLFRPVCAAVQYAHQKLVIHRDIKPGNILVTADGVPKLLDFGIAKLMDTGENSVAGEAPLTPGYASPEQVRGEEVTTAVDVYSLGAVLRKILRDGRERAAPRDLECILRKAMSQLPADRYGSPREFAADIQRFEEGKPVQARAAAPLYLLSRFVGRNRFSVAVAALLACVAVAALSLYLYQARLAQRRFQQLHRFANSLAFDLDDRIRSLPGATSARAEVVRKALEYLNTLAAEKGGDAELQREVANAYRRAGDVQGDPLSSNLGDTAGARRSYEQSIRLLEGLPGRDARKDLVRGYIQLASMERVSGNVGRARELASKALPLAEMAAVPADPDSEQLLGDVHITLTWILDQAGMVAAAADHAGKALAIYRTLADSDPRRLDALATAYSALGSVQMRLGRLHDALDNYRKNLEVRERETKEKPRDAPGLRNLMLAQAHVGDTLGSPTQASLSDWNGALASYREALSIAKRIAAMDPSDKKAELDTSIAMMRVGSSLGAVGQPQAALSQLEEALAITNELAAADPNNSRLAQDSSFILGRMGAQLEALGRRPEALNAYRKSLDIARGRVKKDTADTTAQSGMAWVMELYAVCLAKSGEHDAARDYIPEIVAIGERVAGKGSSEYLRTQAPRAYAAAGAIEETAGRRNEAREWYRKSVDGWAAMVAHQPLSPSVAAEAAEVTAKLSRMGGSVE